MKSQIKLFILLTVFAFCHAITMETNSVFAEELTITSVTGPSYLEGHAPPYSIDNDPATYWQGDLLEFDMGKDVLISQVSIAFLKGPLLVAQVEIQVSTDGLSWTTIFNGTSSGTTSQKEHFTIPETLARYTRIIGHGNTVNILNRFTEVSFDGIAPEPNIISPIRFGLKQTSSKNPPGTGCDCGSQNQTNPCTGRSIDVIVTASPINGLESKDATFTWNFNSGGKDATCGTLANGDYWVAPAAGESSVTITGITGNGTVSADANPVMESMGLLDGSNNYGNYSSSENIIPQLPLTYSSTTSLVAATQRNESLSGNCGTKSIAGECVDAYNIVTIFNTIPPNAGYNILRPNITGETKVLLSLDDFDFSRLPSKSYLNGTDTNGLESIRQRWSHNTEIFGLQYAVSSGYSEGGRAFRSHILVDDYGAGMARQWGDDLMVIFSNDNPISEKQASLASMLSFGLDLYHAMYNNPEGTTRFWGQGATQSPGKFLPAVVMAALLKDPSYSNTLKLVGPGVNGTMQDIGPHELGQIHTGTFGPVWGDYTKYTGVNFLGAYWGSLHDSQCYDGATGTCTVSNGKKTQLDPHGYIDGPPNKPGSNYMISSLGVQRTMVAVMYLIPEVCETINYDMLPKYVNRIHDYGLITKEDPCVTPDSREDPKTCDTYRNTGCIYYGVTWGPKDPTNTHSDCIKIATPPYTKVGRFTALDGKPVEPSYATSQVEINWDSIRGNSITCNK